MNIVIILIACFFLGLEVLRKKGPDCHPQLASHSEPQTRIAYPNDDTAWVAFEFELENIGQQQALIIDGNPQWSPEASNWEHLNPSLRAFASELPRSDGYFESFLIKQGTAEKVTILIKLESKDILNELRALHILRFDFDYKYYCRTPLHYKRLSFEVPVPSIAEVEASELRHYFTPQEKPEPKSKPPFAQVQPLPTKLIRPGDDIIELGCQLVLDYQGKEGDILALAESVVAIAQGSVYYCEDIQPGYWATRLNRIFGMDSSLSSVYSLEMAIREVGVIKILTCIALGALGKLQGKAGEFYRFAGREVATIDDCTGTLPPFDKHVVMGPKKCREIGAAIKSRTGVDVTIVDANDLGKVDILYVSQPGLEDRIVEALKPNPQGNASEMTPFVLIRKAD